MSKLKRSSSGYWCLVQILRRGDGWIYEQEWAALTICKPASPMRTVDSLVRRDLLEEEEHEGKRRWRITGKGRAEVNPDDVFGVAGRV